MYWVLTLVGAALGWFAGGTAGVLLGGVLGQMMDRYWQLDSWSSFKSWLRGRPPLPERDVLFVLLGRLAKVDGRVTDAHIREARQEMQRLGLAEEARRLAIAAFSRGKADQDDLRPVLRRYRRQHAPELAEELLLACWRLIRASGPPSAPALQLLESWGGWLGLTAERVAALDPARLYQSSASASRSRQAAYQNALSVLGVTETTDTAEIRQVYRRQLSRNHPDKLAGRGASVIEVQAATERTRMLHDAYALIRKRRSF